MTDNHGYVRTKRPEDYDNNISMICTPQKYSNTRYACNGCERICILDIDSKTYDKDCIPTLCPFGLESKFYLRWTDLKEMNE